MLALTVAGSYACLWRASIAPAHHVNPQKSKGTLLMTGFASLLFVAMSAPAQCPYCGNPQTSLSFQNGNGFSFSANIGQPQSYYGTPSYGGLPWQPTFSPGYYSAGMPQLYGAPVSYSGCNGGQYQNGFSASRFHFGRNGFRGQSMQSYGYSGPQTFSGGTAFGGLGVR